MKKSSILLVLSAIGLASCASNPSITPDSSVTEDSSSSSTIDSSFSSNEEVEEYVIRVNVPSNMKVTLSKEKAKEGEVVSLTIQIDDGFELVSLKANDEVLTVTNNSASFTMPDRSVTITATLTVTGDVTLQGGIVAVLKEESKDSGLYVARNIKVETSTNFSFKVGNQTLGVTDIDSTKCFAALGASSGATNGNVTIAGGATYDFYYDDNADPSRGRCYIKKVSQDTLPDDVGTLANLFDGRIKAIDTMNVDGVSSISYSNSITDTKYEYTNYTNGSSAKVTRVSDGSEKGFVSKKINGDVYSVVDSYVEYGENYSFDLNSEAYASRYGLVNKESDLAYKKYQMTKDEANFEAHKFSHGLNSLRFDIQDAYYVGFDNSSYGTEGLGLFDRKVVSTASAKGFKVELDSFREIDTTNSTNVDNSDKETSYYTYDVDFTFDKAGKPLSGTYIAKKYGSDAYDFANHVLTNSNKYTVIKNMSFSISYDAVTSENEVDDSMYLSSKITASFTDGLLGSEYDGKNALQLKSGDKDISEFMTLTSDASKALDKSNYTIIASSNESVIGTRSANEPLYFVTKKAGKTTLTIGNPGVASAPRFEVEVEVVANITIFSYFMVGENGWSVPDCLVASDHVVMETGMKYRFRVYGSKDTDLPFTLSIDKPDIMSITAEENKDGHYYITFDARNSSISEQTTINVTLNSVFYDEGISPTVFKVTLIPGSDFSPVGTWYMATTYNDNGDPTGCDKTSVANINIYDGTSETMSSLTYKGVTYNFSLTIDENTKKWTISNKSMSTGGSNFDLTMSETDNGYLGIALSIPGSWSGLDEGSGDNYLLGYGEYDDESGDTIYQYQVFVPSSFAA